MLISGKDLKRFFKDPSLSYGFVTEEQCLVDDVFVGGLINARNIDDNSVVNVLSGLFVPFDKDLPVLDLETVLKEWVEISKIVDEIDRVFEEQLGFGF